MRPGFLEFALKIGVLKNTPRSGWVEAGIDPAESVADHSFRCAVLAMLCGDLKGLDTERMIRMALLHDSHESLIGDLTPDQRSEPEKHMAMKRKAIESVLSDLPKKLRDKYTSIVEEYLDQESPESRLVNELDKLEMAIQASEYRHQGYSHSELQPFFTTARCVIHDGDLKDVLSSILNKVFLRKRKTAR